MFVGPPTVLLNFLAFRFVYILMHGNNQLHIPIIVLDIHSKSSIGNNSNVICNGADR